MFNCLIYMCARACVCCVISVLYSDATNKDRKIVFVALLWEEEEEEEGNENNSSFEPGAP